MLFFHFRIPIFLFYNFKCAFFIRKMSYFNANNGLQTKIYNPYFLLPLHKLNGDAGTSLMYQCHHGITTHSKVFFLITIQSIKNCYFRPFQIINLLIITTFFLKSNEACFSFFFLLANFC